MFELFAIASAIFGGASVIKQGQAQKSARRAEEAQRQQQNLRAAQERRQTIRQMRIAQAAALQRGENQGVADSSGTQGGVGSIVTQGAANLAFLDRNQQLATAAGTWLDKSSRQMQTAGMFSGLSSLAQIGMSVLPTPDWLNPKQTPATVPNTPRPPSPPTIGNLVLNYGRSF